MRKIAFFTEILVEDFDGASRTMFQLINRIDQERFNYFFIYGGGPAQFRDFHSYKVPTFKIPVNDDYCLAIPQLIKKKLELALDEFMPDVIHIATPSLLGFFALNYAKRRNIPVLTIYHTHFISYIAYYFKNMLPLVKPTELWMKRAMNNFYNKCDIVYVPTRSILSELQQIGLQQEGLKLWQRGIDTKLFTPQKRDLSYLRGLTNNDRPTVLFASRLVWEKNIKTLIEIYQAIQIQQLDYNFIVVGEGTAKATAMQEMPKAIFLGKKPHQELARLYASADAFIFPSVSETYGNVVIEAMASGLPSIIANGGGSASLIQHGVNGFKCQPDNAAEYVYYLKQVLSDSKLKRNLVTAGLAYAGQLDWTALTQQYFDDIELLANKTPDTALAWAN
ncbi:glycosyltransferase family 1 protein [Sphingobacterium sp. N143]|uniref:glycosyltransferase family 4 protein n=1 Tax=Sphingobacterium sp. N143 TaxID=2746727 RepID=UPI0025752826|nr:glycosyltransferase family 1 protein [Sphingobacterium sp. N143]MDM1292991.1 glycosyltransferase family 1 protein [Sphingobacterium sp. N143]